MGIEQSIKRTLADDVTANNEAAKFEAPSLLGFRYRRQQTCFSRRHCRSSRDCLKRRERIQGATIVSIDIHYRIDLVVKP